MRYSAEHGSIEDCQNFIGWLLVCTDLQLIDSDPTEAMEEGDRFNVPCVEQALSKSRQVVGVGGTLHKSSHSW